MDFSLNLPFTPALALAGILSLSSLGLVVKVLADGDNLKEPIGLEIFTTVFIAEMLALLLVGFTIGEDAYGESAGHVGVVSILFLLGQIVGFTVVSWLLSARVLPVLIVRLQRMWQTPELSFGLIIGGLFLVVVGAEEIGLHGAIGALLFGAALSGLPRQVRQDVMPGVRSTAQGLFVPLFFASAGLHLDLSFLDLPLLTIAALVAVPLLGKFAGAFLGTFAARLDKPFAQATGLMAKGVAEIALLLVLLEIGVIGQDVFSLLVLIMFGYILLMPVAINFAVDRAKGSHRGAPPGRYAALLRPPRFGGHYGQPRLGPDAGLSRIQHIHQRIRRSLVEPEPARLRGTRQRLSGGHRFADQTPVRPQGDLGGYAGPEHTPLADAGCPAGRADRRRAKTNDR